MKYLIIILLTLGCFKSKSKTANVLVNTFLYNNRYVVIIQDPEDPNLETLDEAKLKSFKANLDNGEDKALKYKSSDINNLQDIVKEIFGKSTIKLDSTIYQYKRHNIVIAYYLEANFLTDKEYIIETFKTIKSNVKKAEESKDQKYYKECCDNNSLVVVNDLDTYKGLVKEAEEMFKD